MSEKRARKPRAGQSAGWVQTMKSAAPGLVVTLIIALIHLWQPAVLSNLGNLVFDSYQRLYPRPYEDADVRVVDIDDETIRRLGQWPWPRTDTARLTQALTDSGAAAIAFDVVFSEPDRTSPSRAAELLRQNPQAKGDYADIAALPDHDLLFGQAMANGPTVASYFMTETPNKARPFEPAGVVAVGTPPMSALPAFNGAIPTLPAIAEKAAGAGFVNVVNRGGGVIRSVPLVARIGERIVPSLSLEALRVAQGAGAIMVKGADASGEFSGGQVAVVAVKVGQYEAPTTQGGELWMHYTADRPERIVPAWRILTGELSPEEIRQKFEGKLVFVGTGAVGLRDLVATPLNANELGVIVHAQAAEQIILGKFLSRPDWALGLERVLVVLFGLALAFLAPTLGALRSGLIAALSLAGTMAASWVSFRYNGLLLEPTMPVLTIALVYTLVTSFSFYREERSRAYIRRAFDRYLSPELVERIARDPGQLELGGEERDMTVLFSDIRSFSRISEKMAPQELISFLIELLTPLTEALLARKATIDKYIGDAVLAFWNAPLDDPDQYRNSANAALDMIDAMKEMNARQSGLVGPWPGDIAIGIGLNAGRCCVGNMGSRQRLSYSLIGDAVNLASRLEGLTKVYGVPILMGQTLAREIPEFAQLEVDQVRVVGRDTPERIFALLGRPVMAGDKDFQAMKTAFADMLAAYRGQQWTAAQTALTRVRAAGAVFGIEKLAGLFAERIARYSLSPPAADWDGVYQAEDK
ncbi:MAG: adenylate cyclase [Caulobacter sp.]|nr:adenylate cyclase [Caulobacter sp.]